jgi:Predicted transmembrane transcriptional regulator (anti-sigma factor)
MNCQHAQNLISSFIDRELSSDETRELRKHLFSCPECDREHQEILRLKSCLENIIQEPIDFDPMQNLRSRMREEEFAFLPPSSKKIWVRRLSIVAACFAIYLVTSALLFPNNRAAAQLAIRHSELNSPPVAWDQNFSIDQSVSVYQASLILP